MRCSSVFTALLVAQSCIDVSRAERPVEAHFPLATNDEEAELPIGGSRETVFSGEAAQVLAAIHPHTVVLQAQSRSLAENSTALLGLSQIQEASGLVLTKSLKVILRNALSNMQLEGEDMGEEGEDCVQSNNCPFTGTVIITHPDHGVKVGCFEHKTMKVEHMQMVEVLHATQIHLKLNIELKQVVIAGVTLDGRVDIAVNIPSFILLIHRGLSGLDPESVKTWSADIRCFHNREEGGSWLGAFVEACVRIMPGKVNDLVKLLLSKFQPEIVTAINGNVNYNVKAATDNTPVKKIKAQGKKIGAKANNILPKTPKIVKKILPMKTQQVKVILPVQRGVNLRMGVNTLRSLDQSERDRLTCVTRRHETADGPWASPDGYESED